MQVNRLLSSGIRSLLPIGSVAIAAVLRAALIPGLRETPYAIFYPAVIISALYGGFWPGMAALALSGLAASTWFSAGGMQFYLPGATTGMVAFLTGGAIMVAICAQLINAQQRISAEAARLREGERAMHAEIDARTHAEEALKQSESFLNAIIENAPACIKLVARDGTLLKMNSAGLEMIGADSLEKVRGKSIHNLVASRDRPAFVSLTQEVFENRPGSLEFEAISLDGRRLRLSTHAVPLHDGAGNITALLGITVDITDRKLAEEKLKRISDQNKLILESAGEGIWGVDSEGTVTFVNHAGASLLGYDEKELIGKPSHLTWHYKRPDGADYPAEECPIYAAYKDGVDHMGEETFWRKDGSGFPADFTSRPIMEAGRITGAVVTFRDISERKHAEEALKASEERLKRSQEIAHLGSWELDLAQGKLTWSDEAYRIFGLQPQEFGATYEAFLDVVHPGDRKAVSEAYSSSVQEGRDTYEIEHRVIRKSTGEIRTVHEKCRHVKDRTGAIVRSIGMVHDITERKQAEQERDRLLADVRRSNTELEQFAYVASHDLQEPLRMVASYTALLERRYKDRLDARAHKYIHFAVDGAQRMHKLIEGLLAYSRITSQGTEFQRVDLNSAFSIAVSNLSVMIQENGAEVTRDELPVISGDETQLVQLFQNLIANGIKYRKVDVPPKMHIAAKQQGQDHLVSVRDNGIGIEGKYYEQVFEIFQRLHARNVYEGTGIGLALCKRIVERHHGRIWVESSPGEGSTFFFSIPVAEASAWVQRAA